MRRRRLALLLLVLLLAGCGSPTTASAPGPASRGPKATAGPSDVLDLGTEPSPLAVRLGDPREFVDPGFRHPPKAGLLFDVDTGVVLWRHRPKLELPIASLTKMMTALVVDRRVPAGSYVRITKQALNTTGSVVGLLPKGKRIGISTMLHGLLLPSGNDAARALAQRAAGGSIPRFVRLMNAQAAQMGLLCSHFATPSGLEDANNHSCAADLAAMARAVLRSPRLSTIVGRRQAVLPFPTKGGRIYLYNHNPLLLEGYRGATGVKTGYTDKSGPCFVATAKRGGVRLGAVLLDSPDIDKQARRLLDIGFRASLR